jgi:hypothetical protein
MTWLALSISTNLQPMVFYEYFSPVTAVASLNSPQMIIAGTNVFGARSYPAMPLA